MNTRDHGATTRTWWFLFPQVIFMAGSTAETWSIRTKQRRPYWALCLRVLGRGKEVISVAHEGILFHVGFRRQYKVYALSDMDSRSRFKAGKGRIQFLSPIREVSGLGPVHVIPYGTKLKKVPGVHRPLLVQSLPVETKERPKRITSGPVDKIVAEYLQYSRYMNFPSSHLDGLLCSCCADRNRESLEIQKSSQSGQNTFRNSSLPKDLPEQHTTQPSLTTHPSPRQVTSYRPSPRDPYYQGYSLNDPYLWTYPHPERSRPFIRESILKPFSRRASAQRAYIRGRVAEANSKYNESMHKLQVHFEKNFSVPEGAVYLGIDKRNWLDDDLL
ncbi:unnamed protein product [Lymnaea stagnalis]|uniref:Uncharacterized protein n=1 Tax=Lymnaea stagnalis TaxID=6523 RepID=A0AAV2I0D7_LYMST